MRVVDWVITVTAVDQPINEPAPAVCSIGQILTGAGGGRHRQLEVDDAPFIVSGLVTETTPAAAASNLLDRLLALFAKSCAFWTARSLELTQNSPLIPWHWTLSRPAGAEDPDSCPPPVFRSPLSVNLVFDEGVERHLRVKDSCSIINHVPPCRLSICIVLDLALVHGVVDLILLGQSYSATSALCLARSDCQRCCCIQQTLEQT